MVESRSAGRGRTRLHTPLLPTRVVVLIGLSTSGYALALAGISWLQAGADAATLADRAPAAAGIDWVAGVNDGLAGDLDDLAVRETTTTTDYQGVVTRIAGYERDLRVLAGTVSAVDGASRVLPASVALPPVVRSVRPASRSTSHATSGGSGVP